MKKGESSQRSGMLSTARSITTRIRKPSFGAVDGLKEADQFISIQVPSRTDARTQIQTERCDRLDRLTNIVCIEPSGQKNRNIHLFADPQAEAPIVSPPGAPEFFDRQGRISGVEQNCVD